MQLQIDQDVDAILADLFRELIVGKAHGASPLRGMLLHAAGGRIRVKVLGVAKNLRLPGIVVLQQRQKK